MHLKVMTFNLRYHNEADGEYAWPKRTNAVRAVIREHEPDVLCTQEGLPEMVSWVGAEFPRFARFGTGRMEDGSDEHVAIFVDTKRFDVTDNGQFWISPEPDVPGSKSWDTIFPRICTWCTLADKETGGQTAVFNVHLDNRQVEARRVGAEIVTRMMHRIRTRAASFPLPSVLCGDFNAFPDTPEVRSFCSADADTAERVVLNGCSEIRQGTYHGFRGTPAGAPIDYILTSPEIRVGKRYVDNRRHEGTWPSDHFPVVADLEIPVEA